MELFIQAVQLLLAQQQMVQVVVVQEWRVMVPTQQEPRVAQVDLVAAEVVLVAVVL
jgi:hypothetical protein